MKNSLSGPQWVKIYIKISLIAGLLASASCAREQSAEDRAREIRERDIQRLSRGAGSFQGVVNTASGGTVPFALAVNISRNPQDDGDSPELQVRMRIGLFGGVDLTSDAVSYDYGRGHLTAKFTPAAGDAGLGKSLEFQGKVAELGIENGQILASSGQVYKVVAGTAPGLQLTEPGLEAIYGLTLSPNDTRMPVEAVLSLTRRTGDIAARVSSDMLRLPQMDGALRFAGTSRLPHETSTVEYDVLMDSLEVSFPGSSDLRMVFPGLSARTGDAQLTFASIPALVGTYTIASKEAGKVAVSSSPTKLIDKVRKTPLPPPYFMGYYENSVGDRLKTVGHAVYLGSVGSAVSAMPFERFLRMRLEITICLGSRAYMSKKLLVDSVDYLAGKATFVREVAGRERVYVDYGDSWNQLDAVIIDDSNDGGGSASGSTRIHLRSVPEATAPLTCADARLVGL